MKKDREQVEACSLPTHGGGEECGRTSMYIIPPAGG